MIKTIVTRSANDKLYEMSKGLWRDNNNFVRCQQFTGYQAALDYLLHLFDGSYKGFIINADEDFFVMNEAEIDSTITRMQEFNIQAIGVPDGGVIAHRTHSPHCLNPFFNIFDATVIARKIHLYNPKHDAHYAAALSGNNDLVEPFAGFFYWLKLNFGTAILDDVFSIDNSGISTVIQTARNPFGIHSWYSREYGSNKTYTDHIDNCYEYALKHRVCN